MRSVFKLHWYVCSPVYTLQKRTVSCRRRSDKFTVIDAKSLNLSLTYISMRPNVQPLSKAIAINGSHTTGELVASLNHSPRFECAAHVRFRLVAVRLLHRRFVTRIMASDLGRHCQTMCPYLLFARSPHTSSTSSLL
jgi:hypothetical protein